MGSPYIPYSLTWRVLISRGLSLSNKSADLVANSAWWLTNSQLTKPNTYTLHIIVPFSFQIQLLYLYIQKHGRHRFSFWPIERVLKGQLSFSQTMPQAWSQRYEVIYRIFNYRVFKLIFYYVYLQNSLRWRSVQRSGS